MDPYIVLLVGTGVLILLVAWLPMLLRELPLSLPMFCVGIGFVAFSLVGGDMPDPLAQPEITERLTELIIIVSLTGAGLKLDRAFGWRSWAMTWRMLAIAMPLSIIGIALIGNLLMGLGVAGALLLGAALAPTDPVLASDVQVGPPRAGEEDEVRFTLTAEAGLNDALAFPFVNLAIGAAVFGAAPGAWTMEWLAVDVMWKLGAGIVVGWAVGGTLAWLIFRLPNRARLARTGDGFVALGITLLSYGVTELLHGYGFLAVFISALAIRSAERQHAYHERLHDYAEQTERLLMMVLLVLFGGALAGGLLDSLTWAGTAAVVLFLFVVRPAAGMLALLGSPQRRIERGLVAFFGIRGLGSFYYLAYALNETAFERSEELWAVVGLTVLVSIILHGTTVTAAMRAFDAQASGRDLAPASLAGPGAAWTDDDAPALHPQPKPSPRAPTQPGT